MCVLRSRTVERRSTLCLIFSITLGLFVSAVFTIRSFATSQSGNTPGLLITPSTVVLQVGEDSAFSAIDETGRPVSDVEWSIKPSIAELHSDNGEIRIGAKAPGRAVLTATANNQIATAILSVVSDDKLPPATIRWSLDPCRVLRPFSLDKLCRHAEAPPFTPLSGANPLTPLSVPLTILGSSSGLLIFPLPLALSLSNIECRSQVKFFKTRRS